MMSNPYYIIEKFDNVVEFRMIVAIFYRVVESKYDYGCIYNEE